MIEGFAAVPNWLVRDTSISQNAKSVYMVLSSHAGAEGTTWLSHATIGAEAGISVSTVQRALRDLLNLGVVTWQQQRRDDGGQWTNVYTVGVHRAPLGQADRGGRSQGPGGSVSVTDEEEPMKKNPRRKTPPSPSAQGTLDDEHFERFWQAYPKRVDKQAARKAWAQVVRSGAHPADVVREAARYAKQVVAAHTETRFIKHPSTWLRATDFDDPPEFYVGVHTSRPGPLSGNDAVQQSLALVQRLQAQETQQIGATRE